MNELALGLLATLALSNVLSGCKEDVELTCDGYEVLVNGDPVGAGTREVCNEYAGCERTTCVNTGEECWRCDTEDSFADSEFSSMGESTYSARVPSAENCMVRCGDKRLDCGCDELLERDSVALREDAPAICGEACGVTSDLCDHVPGAGTRERECLSNCIALFARGCEPEREAWMECEHGSSRGPRCMDLEAHDTASDECAAQKIALLLCEGYVWDCVQGSDQAGALSECTCTLKLLDMSFFNPPGACAPALEVACCGLLSGESNVKCVCGDEAACPTSSTECPVDPRQ